MKCRLHNYPIFILSLLLLILPAMGFALTLEPPPDFPLLAAVKKGDLQKVQFILKETPSAFTKEQVNRKGHSGDTPLSVAALNGRLEMVKLLIDHGAALDGGKETGNRTPLMEAAGRGHVEVVRYLIAQGADVNAKRKGTTPLLDALTARHKIFGPSGDEAGTIRLLLESGANVNVQDESWLKTGRTPLMFAVLKGDAALVQVFMAQGADRGLKNKDGETALSLAKKEGLDYIAQLLEQSGSGQNGSSPKSELPQHPLFNAAKEGRLEEVKALIAKGADVNQRIASGSTPLMFAADGDRLEVVRYLLKSGAVVNAKNGANNTALIFASIKGHLGVVQELLEQKADAGVRNINRGNALIYAVLQKKTPVVGALLKHGAGVNETYDDGKTALLMAIDAGSSDIAHLLIAHRADVNAVDKDDVTALMMACEKGDAGLVEALLKAGADISKKSKQGDTAVSKAIAAKQVWMVRLLTQNSGFTNKAEALFDAVGAGNLEIVQLLLTKDMDVNMPGYASGTLLMSAADGDFSIVKFLLERGADVNKKNDEGQTALMGAVASFDKTNLATLKFLIDRGADVQAVNNKGETALILAVKRGHAEMTRILVEAGSPLAQKDKGGKSAWIYATEGGNREIANLLEKVGAARDYLGTEWKGNGSKQKEKFVKVVETQEEWSDLWKRALEKPAPVMDFDRYVVACVFLGHSAGWLYSIGFGKPVLRGGQWVIPYGLFEVMLRLSGPFKAGGQYHMMVFEKKPGVKMVLEEDSFGKR